MRSFRAFNFAGISLHWLLVLLSTPAVADLVDTIERVKPSVVMVGTFQRLASPQFVVRGTGFVVGDGHIVATNAHVIAETGSDREPSSLVVQVNAAGPEQRVRTARVLVVDKSHDLALLQIDGSALPRVVLGDSDSVKEGRAVAFTGFPLGAILGFTPVTHRGTVSAVTPIALPSGNAQQLKEAVIRRLQNGAFNIFQLDGTAYPGNSGGPLFDVDSGEVVGIINMVLVKSTKEAALSHPTGISYAIPSNYLRDLIANTK
jgi:serine protease Do